jgi:cyclopropane-fatty-acyl-phospholipid synthase
MSRGVSGVLLDSILRQVIRIGRLVVVWPEGETSQYGARSAAPPVGFRLRDAATVRHLATDPGLALGEAYMDGGLSLTEGTIYDLLDLLMSNLERGGSHPIPRAWQYVRQLTRWFAQLNPPRAARRHVAHHYDLDERLYRLFLDPDLQYSCAYFDNPDDTLEHAQQAKKHHIAAKLALNRPGLSVLDIGCGWGGMALTLARDYGAVVTGITLSREQLQVATGRARDAGLADRVRFELADYRDMDRPFDRIVSVGMLEHVGLAHYGRFFGMVRRCLAPDGVALIHTIGRSDGPGHTARWLQKYIFPGGYSPALSELAPHFERAGLILTDLEVLRLHYARTIRLWRERFGRNRDVIASIYDMRFCRMFEFYLCAVELAFRHQGHVNFQLQFSRAVAIPDFTRDYMLAAPEQPGLAVPARAPSVQTESSDG